MRPPRHFPKFAKIPVKISFNHHGEGKQLVWIRGFLKFNGENLEFSDLYKQHHNHISIYRVYKKKISKKSDAEAYVFSIRMDAGHPEFANTKLKRIQLDFGPHKDAYEHCIDEINELFEKYAPNFGKQQKKPAPRPNKAKKVHAVGNVPAEQSDAPGQLSTSSEMFEMPDFSSGEFGAWSQHFQADISDISASETAKKMVPPKPATGNSGIRKRTPKTSIASNAPSSPSEVNTSSSHAFETPPRSKRSSVRRVHFSPEMVSPKASRVSTASPSSSKPAGSLIFDSLKPKKHVPKKPAAKRSAASSPLSVTRPKASDGTQGTRVCIDSSSEDDDVFEQEGPVRGPNIRLRTFSPSMKILSKIAPRLRHSWTSNPAPLSSSRRYGPNSYRFGVYRTSYAPFGSLKMKSDIQLLGPSSTVSEQPSFTCVASSGAPLSLEALEAYSSYSSASGVLPEDYETSSSLGAFGASFGDSGSLMSSQAQFVYSGVSESVSPSAGTSLSFGTAKTPSESLVDRRAVFAAFGLSPPPTPSRKISGDSEPVELKPIAGLLTDSSDPVHELNHSNQNLNKTIKIECADPDTQSYAAPSRRSVRLAESKEKARQMVFEPESPTKKAPQKPRGNSKKMAFDIAKVKNEFFESDEDAPGPSSRKSACARRSKTASGVRNRAKKTIADLSLVKTEPEEDSEPSTKRARISKSSTKKETFYSGVPNAAKFKAFETPLVVKEEPVEEDDYDSDDFQDEYEMMTEEQLHQITWYDDMGRVIPYPFAKEVKPVI